MKILFSPLASVCISPPTSFWLLQRGVRDTNSSDLPKASPKLSGWMEGEREGWGNRWIDGRRGGWIMDGWTDGWREGWMGGQMDRWMDRGREGWIMDGWMDGWKGGGMD